MDADEKETLLGLLVHIFESDERIEGLVYLDIQKIFWHLRNRLDDDNAVKELLPYYWYIDGIVSDPVQEAVNFGLESGELSARSTFDTETGTWYERQSDEHFEPTPEELNGDFEAAKREIERVLEEDYDVTDDYEEKLEVVYEEAPYEFQDYFKFEVLRELELFANNRPWAYSPEELHGRISTAEAYLPLEPEFEEFNTIFSRYVNVARRYFDSVDDEDREFADRFKQLSDNVWRLYCQQLRILEHDPYYETNIDDWKDEYRRTKSLLTTDLVEFRRLIDHEFEGEEDVDRAPEDSTWGKIASDYLGESEAR